MPVRDVLTVLTWFSLVKGSCTVTSSWWARWLSDGWITGLFPNVQIGMHAEGVFIMRFVPHATDPNRFYYDNMLLYRHVEDPNYSVPAWMAMPEGVDTTGQTRPPIERWDAGVEPGIGPVLLQDFELGRAMEIDALVRAPAAFARAAGLSTPMLDLMAALAVQRARDKGLYQP